ncbi:hypothetical protein VTL71DRAFT_2358 [Oculimacula yallundae]|uniref:Uncharacterized protein n=1 Tax=Oculimacula yallundae TaxID=86028 RepID=A0ABR4C9V9_9HELO
MREIFNSLVATVACRITLCPHAGRYVLPRIEASEDLGREQPCTGNFNFFTACLQYVKAKLFMLVSVSGWSTPSFILRVSLTCTSSFSASTHRPWFRYVDARLAILVSVSGWSTPSFVWKVPMTCTSSFLAQHGGPGSLLLIGKRARTLQGWKGISLVARLTKRASSELLSPKEHTIELSSDHKKRRQTSPPDRSSKRSAHRSSKHFDSMHLPKAAIHEESRDTFVDPFPQQGGGPEITTYIKTTTENVHLNTWMQDLAPWSTGEPDITAYMTTFNEGSQSNKWMQDLLPWTVDELDITAYMTCVENSQPDGRMKELFLKPLEVPDLTT